MRRLMVGVAALVLAPVAFSACHYRNCPTDRLCIFKDTNFNGDRRNFQVGDNEDDYDTRHWHNTNDGLDNDTSSAINNTGKWVILYQDEGYNGRKVCFAPDSSLDRFGQLEFGFIHTMDNRISAHKFFNSKPSGCDWTIEGDD